MKKALNLILVIYLLLTLAACSKTNDIESGYRGLKLIKTGEMRLPEEYIPESKSTYMTFHIGSQDEYKINLTAYEQNDKGQVDKLLAYFQYDLDKNSFSELKIDKDPGIVYASTQISDKLFYIKPVYDFNERESTGTKASCQYYSLENEKKTLIYEQKDSLFVYCLNDMVVVDKDLYFITVELRDDEPDRTETVYRLFRYSDNKDLMLIREFSSYYDFNLQEKKGEGTFIPNLYPIKNGFVYNTYDDEKGYVHYFENNKTTTFEINKANLVAQAVANKIYFLYSKSTDYPSYDNVKIIDIETSEIKDSLLSGRHLLMFYTVSDSIGVTVDSAMNQLIIFNPSTEAFIEIDLLTEDHKKLLLETYNEKPKYSIDVIYSYFSRISDTKFTMIYPISTFNRETLKKDTKYYYRIYEIDSSFELLK